MKRSLLPLIFATAALALFPIAASASNQEAIETLNLEKFALPEYPAPLRQIGIMEGYVTVALAPGRSDAGGPADFLVLGSTHPRFAESVAKAMGEWRFAAPRPEAINGPTIIRFQFLSGGVASISIPTFQAGRTAKQAVSADTTIILPTFADLDVTPKALNQPMPRYPAALRAEAVSGTTAVRFFVDVDGQLRMPIVTATTRPEFGEAALEVLKQWKFEIPRQGGQPTIAIGTWNFNFGPSGR